MCFCVEVLVRPDEVMTRGFFKLPHAKNETKNRYQLNGWYMIDVIQMDLHVCLSASQLLWAHC